MNNQFLNKILFSALFLLILSGLSIYIIADTGGSIWDRVKTRLTAPGLSQPSELFWETERAVTYTTRLRPLLQEAFSEIHAAVGKREQRGFLHIKDKDGFLYTGSAFPSHDKNITSYAKRMRRLSEKVAADGGGLLFVGAPDRRSYGMAADFEGYPVNWYSARDMDELMLSLFANGVDNLDLRYSHMAHMAREEMFYRTEPSWTTMAAFEAFGIIVGEVNEKYDLSLDPYGFYRDEENYRVVSYPGQMLGSIGKGAGIAFSGTEDFSIITPGFETEFIYETDYPISATVSGDFEHALLSYNRFASGDPRKNTPYDVYLGGSRGYRRIINRNMPGGARLVLVGDSYFAPVCAFLANVCSEITMFFPLESPANIEWFLAENEYDCVIVAYQPENIRSEAFPFFQVTR